MWFARIDAFCYTGGTLDELSMREYMEKVASMTWALRILSLLALLMILAEYVWPNSPVDLLGSFTANTAANLALATGIVALVDAAQRRRSWFGRLLLAVLVTVYGPYVFFTLLPYSGIHLQVFPPAYTLIYLVSQAITPLAVLLYTLPAHKVEYV